MAFQARMNFGKDRTTAGMRNNLARTGAMFRGVRSLSGMGDDTEVATDGASTLTDWTKALANTGMTAIGLNNAYKGTTGYSAPAPAASSSNKMYWIAGGVVVAAAAAFIIMRRRRG